MAHAPLPSLFNTIKQNFRFVQLFYCSFHSFYVVVRFIFHMSSTVIHYSFTTAKQRQDLPVHDKKADAHKKIKNHTHI